MAPCVPLPLSASQGERRGYVQLEEREDVEVLLVFNPEKHEDRPYAATIYPRESSLSDATAWKWIDKLIPPELRSPMEDNERRYQTPQIGPDCAMYVYGAYIVDLFGDSERSSGTEFGRSGRYEAPSGGYVALRYLS